MADGSDQRLWHFSEDPGIAEFQPRSPRRTSPRAPGSEWLNGPLVWAIDAAHDHLYLFPRECPRIVIWPTPSTTRPDREAWFGDTPARAIAFIETGWVERLRSATLYAYEVPAGSFEPLGDAGMWVSRSTVRPLDRVVLSELEADFLRRSVALRVTDRLALLKSLWQTTLHVSGIRLRNADGWE